MELTHLNGNTYTIDAAAGLLVWFDGELFPKRSQNTAFALLLAALVLGCYVLRLAAELMGHSVI